MSEPSKFVRVNRTAQYILKETIKKRIPGKVVSREYFKKHPRSTNKITVYIAKKTTKTVRVGQSVPEAYAKRFPRLVKKTTTYRTQSSVKVYKKGTKVSKEYAARYPSKVKSIEWVEIQERQIKFDPVLKKQTYGDWKVTSRERMHFYEKILPIKKVTNRSVSDLFSRYKVYNTIWQNSKGTIRITINGHVGGRRVKEVVHIGYLKSVWYNKHNGYSKFKAYLLHKVLEAMRRRKLRLSNPKESLERIRVLRHKLNDASNRLSHAPSFAYESTLSQVKETSKLIRLQKQSSQMQGVTIRIEKLVPR